MTNWILKEIISSQYNNEKSARCTNRSYLFVIEDTITTSVALQT